MDFLLFAQAVFLGILQGITEFLPISSSGHLVVFESVFGLNAEALGAFDIFLHFGTFLALLVFFRKEIAQMFRELAGFFRGNVSESLLAKLALATLPAGIVGILFKDWIEASFREARIVALFFLATAIYFFLVERWSKQTKETASLKNAFLMGVAQIFGLLPGISRSGSVIGGGMLSGLTRESAARFSFLMALPAIGGAALVQGLQIAKQGIAIYDLQTAWPFYAVGFLASAFTSFFAVKIVLKLFKKYSLKVFAAYLACIGFIILLLHYS